MSMIDFIRDNWLTMLLTVLVLGYLWIIIRELSRRPGGERLQVVREWLLWAVARAEIALGSGEGERKLRLVYAWFEDRFPTLFKLISFEEFSAMVDEALDHLRDIFESDAIVDMMIKEAVTAE